MTNHLVIAGIVMLFFSCTASKSIDDFAQRQRVLEERVISLEADKISETDNKSKESDYVTKKEYNVIRGNFVVIEDELKKTREDLTFTIEQIEQTGGLTNDLNKKVSILEKRLSLLEIAIDQQKSPSNTENAQGASEFDTDEKLYKEAFSKYQQKDYDGAVKLFQEYRKRFPKGQYIDLTYYFIGGANFMTENNKDAASELEQLLRLYPKSDKYNDAAFLLGVSYERLKEKEKALDIYNKLTRSSNSNYKIRAEDRINYLNSN